MAIKRIEVKDFLVFKNSFTADFCRGVNVFIGGNGTGKTTLLKLLCVEYKGCFAGKGTDELINEYFGVNTPYNQGDVKIITDETADNVEFNMFGDVFIPEKDILEHARGLLSFIEQKQTGFNEIYRTLLISAQDVYTKMQSSLQKSITEKIGRLIGGYVYWDMKEGSFYTVKDDGSRIPFSHEASGYKRIGLLGLLVSCGQLEPGSILFWDEPENSLNPEYIPVIVDILLELAKSGVQIFVATHSYTLTRFFDVREDKSINVCFHNMSKSEAGQIICDSSPKYIKLANNILEDTAGDVFEAVIQDARKCLMGDDEDE